MNLIIAETMSSESRVKAVASVRRSVSFLVNGKVEALDADPDLPPLVMVLTSRTWTRLWTRWCPAYFVPPLEVLESVWETVQSVLSSRDDVPTQFGGAFRRGFVWGTVPGATGITARERLLVGGGGLFPEHYCLCRVAGFSPEDALRITMEMAVRGGTTPIPIRGAG